MKNLLTFCVLTLSHSSQSCACAHFMTTQAPHGHSLILYEHISELISFTGNPGALESRARESQLPLKCLLSAFCFSSVTTVLHLCWKCCLRTRSTSETSRVSLPNGVLETHRHVVAHRRAPASKKKRKERKTTAKLVGCTFVYCEDVVIVKSFSHCFCFFPFFLSIQKLNLFFYFPYWVVHDNERTITYNKGSHI